MSGFETQTAIGPDEIAQRRDPTGEARMTRAYRQSLRAASRIFRGEAAIITPEERQINILNPTATEIWELCAAQTLTSDQICTVMTDRYEADAETIRADVEELLDELVEMGALEVVEAAATGSGESS